MAVNEGELSAVGIMCKVISFAVKVALALLSNDHIPLLAFLTSLVGLLDG
jgi:hypothetical protein